MLFLEDGENVILVASQGGLPKNPMWYLNIKADPVVTVQIKSRIRSMKARVAAEDERARLWPMLRAMYPDFDNYQGLDRPGHSRHRVRATEELNELFTTKRLH